ncbi:protein of unknown function (DUF3121) [Pseudoalteromonas luteoviolacea]|uniref:Periplasmic protein n=1 Tax=Pseudoalteromonas luteoviolacea (strain 2ta16) TaxID=1353533 RepID=V4HRB5_PSEL2|nr:protein of unknown function (DUF3121) [Pseudoalteromonas luteoviolacea]ESP92298.1 protein of unknown function (DUF3121) [Pseudoalteromonas luteoviolacea 2ta16]KZN36381.1 hypothetical protein N483_22380 [Pseudoalteromonas luteoviolacea NCIMB 1944]
MNNWFALMTLCASIAAHAHETIDANLTACQNIQQDQQRLQCYDQFMNQYQSKQVVKNNQANTALPHQHNAVEQTNSTQPERFGLENKITQQKDYVDNITAKVTQVNKSAHGVRTFELSNQQVWKQIGSDAFFAKQGDSVTIKRGSFSSFLMSKSGSSRTIRVKRIK